MAYEHDRHTKEIIHIIIDDTVILIHGQRGRTDPSNRCIFT